MYICMYVCIFVYLLMSVYIHTFDFCASWNSLDMCLGGTNSSESPEMNRIGWVRSAIFSSLDRDMAALIEQLVVCMYVCMYVCKFS